MVKTPTILAKVKLQIDKTPFLKNLNSVNRETGKIISNNMKKKSIDAIKLQIADLDKVINSSLNRSAVKKSVIKKNNLQKDIYKIDKTDSAGKSGSSLGKGFGKLLGGVGKIGGLVGKIFAGVSLASAALVVFQPALKILGSIFKIIGEFLRPVGDVVMFLLQPIMMMLKPLLITFRTLIRPFKLIALKGMAAANSLIVKGGRIGGEKGAVLTKAGMSGALSSASLLLSGFLDIVFTPLKNISALGIGKSITNTIKSWQSDAIGGVIAVVDKAKVVSNLGKHLVDVTGGTLTTWFTDIDALVEDLKNKTGEFTTKNFDDNLTKSQSILDKMFDPFIKTLKSGGKMDTAMSNLNTRTIALSKSYPLFSKATSELITDLGTDMIKLQKIKQQTAIDTGIGGLKNKLNDVKGPSIFDYAAKATPLSLIYNGIKEGFSDKSFGDKVTSFINDIVPESALSKKQKILDDYMNKINLTTETEKLNFLSRYNLADTYFNPKTGIININIKKGYDDINTATKIFATNMTNAAKKISKAASTARSAASSASSYASSARSYSTNLYSSRGH